jgi:hypothetical protein
MATEETLAKNVVFHVPPGLADGFGGKAFAYRC